MLRLPSRAVPWHEQVGRHGGKCFHSRGYARREVRAAQVQTGEECVQAGYRRQPLGVSHDIHGAGMRIRSLRAGLFHGLDDERLIIEYQRVGSPCRVGPALMRWGHAAFEVGSPVDLAGDQDRAVEQERWLTALDHIEALACERTLAQ